MANYNFQVFQKTNMDKAMFKFRITSYNVCYTKLLRDHAPGVLIHREAGGYAARRDGVPYDPTERFRSLLAAPDEDSWHRLHEFLKPG